MLPPEYRTTFALAAIFGLRMMGLFMVLPVLSVYAQNLQSYTPTLLGIALGIYGLSQAILQIPFGYLSDRFGRKPIITVGLLIFALGSIIAALSESMYGIILGRLLQGAGAIGSTLIAMVADLTSEENRTRAMAIIGITIGITFSLGMILGPILASYTSVQGLFWLSSGLGLWALIILHTLVPTPASNQKPMQTNPMRNVFKSVLTHPELLRLDLGILMQHAILTALFVVTPIVLTNHLSLDTSQHWHIYLPILIFSSISS